MNDKARAAIYGTAGIYLLFMAYNIYIARMDNGGSDYTLMIVFFIIFLILGIGLIAFALYMAKKK